MSREPSGTKSNGTLAFTRTFVQSIDEVWRWVTDPERCEVWFGTWHVDAAEGRTIPLTMTAEEGSATSDVTIRECRAPHRLRVTMVEAENPWELGMGLHDSEDGTVVTLTQEVGEGADIGSYGPGWEYYLDRLRAAMYDEQMPEWDDYYPAMRDYYEAL